MKKHPYNYTSGSSFISPPVRHPGRATDVGVVDLPLRGMNGNELATAAGVERLTRREQEVLELLSKGFLYKEICGELGIALPTVKSHLRQIYGKLDVQTRTEAAVKFLAAK